MDEEFGRGTTVHLLVGRNHHPHQFGRFLVAEMKAVIGLGVPGTDRALEDDSLPRIQEHLGTTTGVVAALGVLDVLKDEADVADALPNVSNAPGPPPPCRS